MGAYEVDVVLLENIAITLPRKINNYSTCNMRDVESLWMSEKGLIIEPSP